MKRRKSIRKRRRPRQHNSHLHVCLTTKEASQFLAWLSLQALDQTVEKAFGKAIPMYRFESETPTIMNNTRF